MNSLICAIFYDYDIHEFLKNKNREARHAWYKITILSSPCICIIILGYFNFDEFQREFMYIQISILDFILI